jgi:predicted deacylase
LRIQIAGMEIPPESRTSVQIPVPGLYAHAPMSMPVRVVTGKEDGPVLLILACVHGDEINGMEIIRRLLLHPSVRRIRGAIVAVPVVNVYGLQAHSRYMPDRRDLNRSFPGSERGSLTARMAHIVVRELLSIATHCIDIHTGALHRYNLPQIRAALSDRRNLELARAFGAPVILDSESFEGSVRHAAGKMFNIPCLLYEAGEALRYDELSIRTGVRGLLRVMRHLRMIGRTREKKPDFEPLIFRQSSWVRAPVSGVMRDTRQPGDIIDRDEILGWIGDPFAEKQEAVINPASGMVICTTNIPLVNEGEALFHIARFDGNSVSDMHDTLQTYRDIIRIADEFLGPVTGASE